MYNKQVNMKINKVTIGCDEQLPLYDLGGYLNIVSGEGGESSLRRRHLSWNLKDRKNLLCVVGIEPSRQRPETVQRP